MAQTQQPGFKRQAQSRRFAEQSGFRAARAAAQGGSAAETESRPRGAQGLQSSWREMKLPPSLLNLPRWAAPAGLVTRYIGEEDAGMPFNCSGTAPTVLGTSIPRLSKRATTPSFLWRRWRRDVEIARNCILAESPLPLAIAERPASYQDQFRLLTLQIDERMEVVREALDRGDDSLPLWEFASNRSGDRD
jgi:hypothetical protein